MVRKIAFQEAAPRRVLLTTAVLTAVVMGDSMLYNVLPAQVSAFAIPVSLVGVLLGVNRFVRLVSNPFASWVYKHFGLVKPLVATVMVSVATTITYGLAQGFGLLLLARVLWGICFSILRLSGYMMVLEDGEERTRGKLMGLFRGGPRVGSAIGVFLGGILFDLTGRRASFLIIGALGLLGLPAALALTEHGQRSIGGTPSTRTDPSHKTSAPHPEGSRQHIWDVMVSPVPELDVRRRRQLLAVNFVSLAFNFVMSGLVMATLGFLLNQRLGSGVTVAGIAIGIATLNGALLAVRFLSDLAAPYFGYLGDRLGRELVLLSTIPICITALLFLAYPVALPLMLVWLVFTFLATTTALTMLDAMVGNLAPANRRAQVMSRYATWQDIGSATGPLLGYAVLSFTSLTLVYLGSALLLATATGAFCLALRHPRVRLN
ncbi:MFS transporter [Chloroflexota bacterium]